MVHFLLLGFAMTQDADKMAQMIEDSYYYVFTMKHIRESNEIEGIHRDTTDAEVNEHRRIMNQDEITVEDLMRHVAIYAGPQHRIRALTTDRHYIGRRALEGGPHVLERLREILHDANTEAMDPWHTHVEYEYLHPFTDGNGRSGRMLWHWAMKKKYGKRYESMTSIGFLQRFYYQSMQFYPNSLYD
jgi:hypothetical protein